MADSQTSRLRPTRRPWKQRLLAKDQMARAATELRTLCDSTVPDPGNQLLEIAVDSRFDT